MKNTILSLAIMIGLMGSAQAMSKADACQNVSKLAEAVMEVKSQITQAQAIQLSKEQLSGTGLTYSQENYLIGVVAIAYETNLSPRSYGTAVYANCMNHF